MTKVEIIHFSFCHNVFKNVSAAEASKCVHVEKGLTSRCSAPFPHFKFTLYYFSLKLGIVTLSHVQQICSRRLWKHIGKNWKVSLFKYSYWIKLKTLWQNKKCNISFLPDYYQLYSIFCRLERGKIFILTLILLNSWNLISHSHVLTYFMD